MAIDVNYIFIASALAIKSSRRFFAIVLAVSLVAFTFLMNIVSPYGLIFYREIIIPEGTGIDAPIFLAVFSFLLALSLAIHKHKYDMTRKLGTGEGGAGAAGIFAGLITSACPICPPLILSLFGIPASIAVFPLGGWEVRIVSLALIFVSIYLGAKGMGKAGLCEIKA